MTVATHQVETRIQNRIPAIASVADLVSSFCAAHKLSQQLLVALSVSLDEALNNIISYGYSDAGDHSILVRLAYEPGSVAATIEDDGNFFDPLSVKRRDLHSPDRVGGYGIHFITNLMDDVQYGCQHGINRLVMRKRIV